MLQIRHLTIVHRKDLRTILDDVSFVLNPGDKAVVVGEEGNGKSTLLKWIFDPKLVEPYADAEGTRALQGEKLAYLPQELDAADQGRSVYEYLAARDSFLEATPKTLAALAGQLGLSTDFFYGDQTMGSLSGGERVKLQMAALLLEQPDILLLDEPSNDIDLETLQWLEELISAWTGSVLFISHDETLIERTANRVILLEQLRRKTESRFTVANLSYAQFMEERSSAFEKQGQLAVSERREEKKAMEKFRRIQQRVEHEQEIISRQDPHGGRLLKKKMASVKAMERRYMREHEEMTEYPTYEQPIVIRFNRQRPLSPGKTVLDLHLPELRCGEKVLARNVELTVRGPEKVGIVGRNGAGKTTLLRQIHALLLEREDLHVCYMPQDYEEQLPMDMTPVDYLTPSGDKEERVFAQNCLGALRYTFDEMGHPIRALSGGQKAKLLLLKLSLEDADVLILDEPTRNFSPLSGPEVRAMLRSFQGAIISVSHDRKYLSEVCDRVVRLTGQGLEPG